MIKIQHDVAGVQAQTTASPQRSEQKTASSDRYEGTGTGRRTGAVVAAMLLSGLSGAAARGLQSPWQDKHVVSKLPLRQSAGGNQGEAVGQAAAQNLRQLTGGFSQAPVTAPRAAPAAQVPGPAQTEPDHGLAPITAPKGAEAPGL